VQTRAQVNATWWDNFGMWIGVTVGILGMRVAAQILGYLLHVVASPWPGDMLIWVVLGVALGGVAFGALMMWRTSLDEREQAGEIMELLEAAEAAEAALADAEMQIAQLTAQLARAQEAEQKSTMLLHRAQHAVQPNYVAPERPATEFEGDNTYEDARQLVRLATTGQRFAKDFMVREHDWSQGQWRAAHELVTESGIWHTEGRTTVLTVTDQAAALSHLARYCGQDG
jgi:Tfp pilus assembly protein PilX